VRFHWGHNHDFGTFALDGRMGDRHLWLLETYIDCFGALPGSLEGKHVLDVGCWTGGTSLLLAAMGARVLAIDEVKKYVEALKFLVEAFQIQNLTAAHLSLFDCGAPEFDDRFDYVLCAGVLYHVTDPVLALRHTFNCLKDGGKLLLETMACEPAREGARAKRAVEYWGPTEVSFGRAEELDRAGWNWFVPEPAALSQMLSDVGYGEVSVGPVEQGRAFAVARRTRHVDMLRAGLSLRHVR
jgi:SAM-dependent methyltransferase